jgi:hypothetical protein
MNDVRRAPRGFGWVTALLAVLLLAAVIAGCASTDYTGGDDTADLGTGEPLPPPKATVEIAYTHPGDTLARATVLKFFGAEVLLSREVRPGRTASVVRFEGGVPIWQLKADRTLVGRISELTGAQYALKQIEYGKVPAHFDQIIPDEGPPEPLDRGAYYVFEVSRGSGSASYQAVKVLADGSLEAYNAQPRAGSSYLLCCNIAADFPEPVVVPEESISDDSGAADQGTDNPSPDNPSPDNPSPDGGN